MKENVIYRIQNANDMVEFQLNADGSLLLHQFNGLNSCEMLLTTDQRKTLKQFLEKNES